MRTRKTFTMLMAVCTALVVVALTGPAQASAATLTRIKTAAVEKCLRISDSGKGGFVEVAKCASSALAYESWYVDTLPSGAVRLRSAAAYTWNECIDGFRGKAKQVVMIKCDGTADQAFIKRFIYNSTDFFTLESARYRGLCLDVKDWGQSPVVQLWDCHTGGNQVWWYWK